MAFQKIALTLAAASCLVLAGCGDDSSKPAPKKAEAPAATASSGPLKAAWIYPSPSADEGWSKQHDESRQLIQKQFGDKIKTQFVETDNFSYYNARFYQARYLAGKLAASMSKDGHLGYVAAVPIPEVLQGINAYTLGAQTINPNVKVDVVWTNTWYDPGKEADATNTLIGQGCDIITHHTNSQAVASTAESKGVKVISYNSPMVKAAPTQLIGAVTHHWDEFYAKRIQAVMDGKWKVEPIWGGAEMHMVRLSNISKDASKKVVDDINATYAKMEKQEFDVFTGPIVDNEGKVQIPEGKRADDKMLTTMNYFVKGVTGKVPSNK